MNGERRQSWRIELAIEGKARFAGTDGRQTERKVLTKNVNAGGAYLLTDTASSVGTDIELSLENWPFFGYQPALVFVGNILRVEQLAVSSYGFAVRFDDSPTLQGH